MRGIFWLAEGLLASQEESCSIELKEHCHIVVIASHSVCLVAERGACTLFNPYKPIKVKVPLLSNARPFPKHRCFLRFSGLAVCPGNSNMSMKMSMEHWWKDTDWGKPKYSEKNLSPCQFSHQKFHMDWAGIETRHPRREAGVLRQKLFSIIFEDSVRTSQRTVVLLLKRPVG